MKFIIALVAVLAFAKLFDVTTAADCSELGPPEYIGVRPFLTSASITIRGVPDTTCEITEAIVSCTNDGTDQFERTISVDITIQWIFLDVKDLEPDTVYTCFVRWPTSPINTGGIRFRTRDLVRKQLSISDITETAFNVSWTEDYDPDFVINNQLQIRLGGPLHFPRNDCDLDTPLWYNFDFDNTVLSFVFDNGLPNYAYTAQLVTNYNLSISDFNEVSFLETARLNPAAPAVPEDLTVDFRCEGETGYNVTAVVSWMAPCELNGVLASFDVTVQAIFVQGGNVGVEYTTSMEAISPNYRYLYELPELSPLFRYVVSVSTVAAFTGPPSEINITPPDVNYCT